MKRLESRRSSEDADHPKLSGFPLPGMIHHDRHAHAEAALAAGNVIQYSWVGNCFFLELTAAQAYHRFERSARRIPLRDGRAVPDVSKQGAKADWFESNMKTMRSPSWMAVLFLSVLTFAGGANAQARKAAPAAPAFEVVSFKHTGNARDGQRMEGNTVFARTFTRLAYNGVKLTGEDSLQFFIEFAYSPLLTPFHSEAPQWVTNNEEFYRIDAIAPAGTSIDAARAMLRTMLAERLGFQHHVADRETPIYALTRGSGDLRLAPSTETEPDPGAHQWGVFKNKSATLAAFAEFLTGIAGRSVVDRTGIQGLYKFNLDWSKAIQNERQSGGWDPRDGDPGVAFAEVKSLGLKLEPGKDLQKVLVVDHVNKEPTPN